VCVWCVCVRFVHLFQDDLRCLVSPHQVNHGGVQKPPAEVSLYKSHTTEHTLGCRCAETETLRLNPQIDKSEIDAAPQINKQKEAFFSTFLFLNSRILSKSRNFRS
jgi:hypothetical protein